MIGHILLLILGFIMLIKGADVFVEGAAGIAKKLGIPELVIGLTIVAMGTSAPEAAVSITAATKGNAGICIGNVVGSNIMNVLVILGISCVIFSLPIAKSTLFCEIPFMIFIFIVLLVMGITGDKVVFVEGIILWVLFIAYLVYLFLLTKKGSNKQDTTEDNNDVSKPIPVLLLFVVIGAGVIVGGSNLAVNNATEIARIIGITERIIGLTIVAFGTSLPELVTSVAAAKKGSVDIAVGNIVGSNLFNMLFVIGTTALISVVPFEPNFVIDSVIMIATGILLWLSVIKTKKLTRPWGIVMLLSYAAYFVYLLV